MAPAILVVLVGTVVVVMVMRMVPRRRDQLAALEEMAVEAGWQAIRRAMFATSVAGVWKRHRVRVAVFADDSNDFYLKTELNADTGVRITVRAKQHRPWWETDLGPSLPLIRMRDPLLDAELAVGSDQEALVGLILDDQTLVEPLRKLVKAGGISITPERILIQRELGEIVIRGHDMVRLNQLARRDWDLAAQLYDRITLHRSDATR